MFILESSLIENLFLKYMLFASREKMKSSEMVKKQTIKQTKKPLLSKELFFDLLNKFHKGAKTPNGPGLQGLYFKAGHP